MPTPSETRPGFFKTHDTIGDYHSFQPGIGRTMPDNYEPAPMSARERAFRTDVVHGQPEDLNETPPEIKRLIEPQNLDSAYAFDAIRQATGSAKRRATRDEAHEDSCDCSDCKEAIRLYGTRDRNIIFAKKFNARNRK